MKGPVPPGAVVWIRHRRWRVEAARSVGRVVRLDVNSRAGRATFLVPFDRPGLERVQPRLRYARPQAATARLANALARRAFGLRTLLSAIDARADILPHQLEPALAVLGGARRVLIADSAGLGKTVQAGLVIAELVRRWRSTRALVVVPAILREQWRDELAVRFGLDAEIADRRNLAAATRLIAGRHNPWDHANLWIASADFLKQTHVVDTMSLRPWDIVVIDEAHDASGPTDRYEACDRVARRARCVLLLTATPHGGDDTRFDRLTSIGRLPVPGDTVTVFRRTRLSLAGTRTRRLRWHRIGLSAAETAALDVLQAFEQTTLQAAGADGRHEALLLLSVLRKRALSTMDALRVSVARRLAWLDAAGHPSTPEWLQPQLQFGTDSDDDMAGSDRAGLTAVTGLPATRERAWLGRLERLATVAGRHETKVGRLARLVARSREPCVIFTEFRHTLTVIARRLAACRRVAVLHGGQGERERRMALDDFLGARASVLVATDVAGQGLNLQSRSRWVVNVELPWTPARLEQRIGRVDRIGQRHDVHATLLVARHEAEGGLLARLASRTLNARQALGDDRLAGPVAVESAVAELLIGGRAPAVTAVRARIPPDGRWRLPARAAARTLLRRRGLSRRWRGDASLARGCWASLRKLGQIQARYPDGLTVLGVSLRDSTGAVIEVVLLPVRGSAGVNAAQQLARAAAAGDALGCRLTARRRRVERLLDRQRQHAAQIEQAIANDLWRASRSGETQPGLFAARESPTSAGTRAWAADLARECEARVRQLSGSRGLELGPVRVEFLFLSHR